MCMYSQHFRENDVRSERDSSPSSLRVSFFNVHLDVGHRASTRKRHVQLPVREYRPFKVYTNL